MRDDQTLQQPQSPPKFSSPIFFKVSLRHHSPQQIYNYIDKHVGELGMKIKKKQAIIGFQSGAHYEKMVNQYRVVNLRGREIQFVPISEAEENCLQSEQDEREETREEAKRKDFTQLGTRLREVKYGNEVEAKVSKCQLEMLEKVQKLVEPTMNVTHQKVQQLKRQYADEGPRKREMFCLESVVERKLVSLQNKYQTQIEKLNQIILNFNEKSIIDLQPTFHFEENDKWQFTAIPLNNMKFQPVTAFKNRDSFQCKRLCAINGNQFAVSMYSPKRHKGYIKIYDVHQAQPKKIIPADPGAYGLCRVNNYILAGSYDNTIKYVNLQDNEQQLEASRQLSQTSGTFFDLKLSRSSTDKNQILALNTDLKLRRFQLSFDQIMQDVYTANFDLKNELNIDGQCITFEIITSSIILFGGMKKIRKFNIEKQQIIKDILIKDKAIKIKKFNHCQFAVASIKVVQIIDLRVERVVQSFPHIYKQIRSIEVVGPHSIMYGTHSEIGLLDDRKLVYFPWKSENHHTGMVYDILKLENRIVSCDQSGIIRSWKLSDEERENKDNGQNDPIIV